MPEINTAVSDAATSGGANFDLLTTDRSTPTSAAPETPVTIIETPAEVANPVFPEGFYEKPPVPGTPEAEVEKVVASEPVVTEEPVATEGEFTLPSFETDANNAPAAEAPATESLWLDVAKEAGISLPENSKEAFVNALKERDQASLDAVKEQARVDFETQFVASLPEDIKGLYEYTKMGGDAQNYKGSFEQINTLKNLTNIELVEADLAARQGWTEEMVQTELNIQMEKGFIDHEAAKLRVILDGNEQNIKNRLLAEQTQRQAEAQNIAQQEFASQTNQIRESLSKRKDFAGRQMKQEYIDAAMKKWEGGEIKRDFASNPDKVAEFILWDTFGSQVIGDLKKESYQSGKSKVTAKLSNIPVLAPEGSTAPVKRVHEQSEGGFENLRELRS